MSTFTDRHRGDFSNNGGSGSLGDLVLENNADSGFVAIWLMSASQRLGAGTNLVDLGPTWHVRAAVEFSVAGNGNADILFQSDDGQLQIREINGNNATGNVTVPNVVTLPTQSPLWTIPTSNDFNGDAASDILFQRSDNGQIAIWLITNTTTPPPANQQINILQNPGAGWHVVASGDFNNDQAAGIVLQHDTGAVAIWENFQNLGFQEGRFNSQVDVANNGPTWHVVASADFDADRNADLLWRNDNGAAASWLMNGSAPKAGGQLNIAQNNGPTWHIVGARDMDGDAQAGILWQNDNGTSAVWENFSVGPGGTAVFSRQENINPQPDPNPAPPIDWHIV
jgi:hypothetical protein